MKDFLHYEPLDVPDISGYTPVWTFSQLNTALQFRDMYYENLIKACVFPTFGGELYTLYVESRLWNTTIEREIAELLPSHA